MGFRGALYVGATLNLLLASSAFALTVGKVRKTGGEATPAPERPALPAIDGGERKLLWILFGTGLTSMGAEVIWIRLYTPSLSTVVYAFAAILGLYLLATYLGSRLYRTGKWSNVDSGPLWAALGFSVLLSFSSADPRGTVASADARTGRGGAVLPPGWIRNPDDGGSLLQWGDPDRAGKAYAINIVGCILGPLASGFLLLPSFGERFSLCLFAFPWFVAGLVGSLPRLRSKLTTRAGLSVGFVFCVSYNRVREGFEEQFLPRTVLRDNTATVVAIGTGHSKRLLVNGVGMTVLTPTTKLMAHLPLAFLSILQKMP